MGLFVGEPLGTWVDLLIQPFSAPPRIRTGILEAAERLATGPVQVPVRTVARLKGPLGSTWLSSCVATPVRTRMAAVVDSRPPARSDARRDVCRARRADVTLTLAARDEARWWVWLLLRHSGAPIGPQPFDARVDSVPR